MAHKGFNQPQYCVKKPTDSATGWFAIPWNQELFLGNTVTPLAKSLDAIINPIIPRKNLNLLTPTIAIPTSNHLSGLHCYIIRRVYHVFSVGTTHWNSQWNSHQIGGTPRSFHPPFILNTPCSETIERCSISTSLRHLGTIHSHGGTPTMDTPLFWVLLKMSDHQNHRFQYSNGIILDDLVVPPWLRNPHMYT